MTNGQNLTNILEIASQYRKILVTGPQRSGTHIAAQIISAELGYKYLEEEEVRIRSLSLLFKELFSHRESVIQGPAFSHISHLIDIRDCLVVFMMRDLKEIYKSEKSIEWGGKAESFELMGYFAKEGKSAKIKYDSWNEIQKPNMKCKWVELNYYDLKSHPMFDKSIRRKKFLL
ncbi:MAG: hypothetical protein ACW99G_03580 [Candidatus Thorarchaeota archaeon]